MKYYFKKSDLDGSNFVLIEKLEKRYGYFKFDTICIEDLFNLLSKTLKSLENIEKEFEEFKEYIDR